MVYFVFNYFLACVKLRPVIIKAVSLKPTFAFDLSYDATISSPQIDCHFWSHFSLLFHSNHFQPHNSHLSPRFE